MSFAFVPILANRPKPAASVAYASQASSETDASSYTFSSLALGTTKPTRRIVVGVQARQGSGTPFTINSVTVGGISAAMVASVANTAGGYNRVGLYIADVPQGATGDVVVVLSTTIARCGVIVWAVYDLGVAMPSMIATSTADDGTAAIEVPARGIVIAASGTFNSGGSTSATWSGLTENVDVALGGFANQSGASLAFATARANYGITCDWASPVESVLAVAAFR